MSLTRAGLKPSTHTFTHTSTSACRPTTPSKEKPKPEPEGTTKKDLTPLPLPPTSPLSCNWKILQQRIKAGEKEAVSKSASPGLGDKKGKKRKVGDIASIKGDGTTVGKSKKLRMEKRESSTAASIFAKGGNGKLGKKKVMQKKRRDQLALFAEDNDISPGGLVRADITATSTATTTNTTATTKPLPTHSISLESHLRSISLEPHLESHLESHLRSAPISQKATLGKFLALDCEMVGYSPPGTPLSQQKSQLARVSIVNYHGHCLYDTFVLPQHPVTDYRTPISGIRPADIAPNSSAVPFSQAQSTVSSLLRGRILVAHAVHNDLNTLGLKHPRRDIRDTSRFELFRKLYGNGKSPALKKVVREVLGVEVQGGEHSSVEDAKVCMLLYKKFKKEFEEANANEFGNVRGGRGTRRGGEVGRVIVGGGVILEEKKEVGIGKGVGNGKKKSQQGGDSDEENWDGAEPKEGDELEGANGAEGAERNPKSRRKRSRNKKKKKGKYQ